MNAAADHAKNYLIADFESMTPTPCPCGLARRAFLDDPAQVASLHIVDIKKDAVTHYHKTMTEIYYVLEGSGYFELDGERVAVHPGSSAMIKPGCRHRAVGEMKIINIPIPAFDPNDEWFD
jgi:mannose-6-phosphate isomerase-like protein (cupin superfamily)